MNNKIEIFKRLFLNQSMSLMELEYLRDKGVITQDEFFTIAKTPRIEPDERINKTYYNFMVWDKISDVKTEGGTFSAKEFMFLNDLNPNKDYILFGMNGIVKEFASVDTLRNNNRIEADVPAYEVGKIITEMKNKELDQVQTFSEDLEMSIGLLQDVRRTDELQEIKLLLTDIKELLVKRLTNNGNIL